MNITVEVRTVYGEDKFYPACEASRLFAQLLGQTTLTRPNLQIIKQLGYEVTPVHRFTAEQPFI